MNHLQDIKDWAIANGFFCPNIESMGRWNRLVICTHQGKSGYGGKSLWVTFIGGRWYLGTWAGMLYRICSEKLLNELLEQIMSDGTPWVTCLAPQLCEDYELDNVSKEQFDLILRSLGRSDE